MSRRRVSQFHLDVYKSIIHTVEFARPGLMRVARVFVYYACSSTTLRGRRHAISDNNIRRLGYILYFILPCINPRPCLSPSLLHVINQRSGYWIRSYLILYVQMYPFITIIIEQTSSSMLSMLAEACTCVCSYSASGIDTIRHDTTRQHIR